MSVKRALLIAVLATACGDKAAKPAASSAREAAAAPIAAAEARVAQVRGPDPKLPPPPPEQRAEVVLRAPSAAKLLPDCENVKVRIYADGVRRSCMTGFADGAPQVFASCGDRAELPAEKAVKLEVHYEQRGVVLAKLDLGERTLDVGQQTLDAQGTVTYGDVKRHCPTR